MVQLTRWMKKTQVRRENAVQRAVFLADRCTRSRRVPSSQAAGRAVASAPLLACHRRKILALLPSPMSLQNSRFRPLYASTNHVSSLFMPHKYTEVIRPKHSTSPSPRGQIHKDGMAGPSDTGGSYLNMAASKSTMSTAALNVGGARSTAR